MISRAILLVHSLLFLFSTAHALECIQTGKIHYRDREKQVERQEAYCFDQKQDILIRQSCMKDSSCLATKKRNLPKDFQLNTGGLGNPLFGLCARFSGQARIIQYWSGKGWEESSWCEFPDGSFVSLGYLYSTLNRAD